jgi:hypothetical protein
MTIARERILGNPQAGGVACADLSAGALSRGATNEILFVFRIKGFVLINKNGRHRPLNSEKIYNSLI